jgi:hypothetical protein
MLERRDRIYAELGVPPEEPEDPLDRWLRMKAEREEPRERKLDIVPPTLAEIDQRIGERIAAEHEFMIDIVGGVVAQLRREWVVGAKGRGARRPDSARDSRSARARRRRIHQRAGAALRDQAAGGNEASRRA